MKEETLQILKNIREIRLSKKLSQENTADVIGIDTSTYSKIENGKIDLTIDRLAELAHYFEMRTIDILTWPNIYVDQNDRPELKRVKAILQIELDHEKKEQVLKLVFGANNVEIFNK